MIEKEITTMNLNNAKYYGQHLQMNQFTEELAELIQAVAEGDPQHIAEEIADVELLIEQLEHLLPLDADNIAGVAWSYTNDNVNLDSFLSCIWNLAAPIKSINKYRRVQMNMDRNLYSSKEEAYCNSRNAKDDLELCMGGLVSTIKWLVKKYSITNDVFLSIKAYKVQRTRDRIELETGSICKKAVDGKAVAQAQDLSDYCKQQTECEPGGCIFATTGEGCILADYVRPELWPDAIAKKNQQEGRKNG